MSSDWRDDAACRGRADLFFASEDESGDARQARETEARAICAGCPSRQPCLTFALATRQDHGTWGGQSEEERRRERRRTARRQAARRRAAAEKAA